MNLIFMGTTDFAVPALKALAGAGHCILAVYTQPDRPAGRGLRVTMSPVKAAALGLGLEVVQPERLTDGEELKRLEEMKPDLVAVVAYGLKLPPSFLSIPKLGAINLHPSLLPKYRGAAPINWALINGETETGITVIRMNSRMDAGDIVLQEVVTIDPEENAGELEARLSELGAGMMVKAMEAIASGKACFMSQKNTEATLAPKIKPEDCRIDWKQSGQRIINLVRGLTPRPGAFTLFRGRRLEIAKLQIVTESIKYNQDSRPGEIVGWERSLGPVVRCGDGFLVLIKMKPEGKREMSGEEFVRGCRLKPPEYMG